MKLQFVLKAGFDSNQPRVPGGNADGGQWTDNGGGGRLAALVGGGGAQERAIHRARARDRRKIIIEGRRADFSIAPNPRAKRTAPRHEDPRNSQVKVYHVEIERVALETGVDANLIRAIMFMETTHGHYGGLGPLPDEFRVSGSILPMNISADFWGNTFGSRATLEIPLNKILAGAKLLKEIIRRLPTKASVAEIATLYNDLGARQITDYGVVRWLGIGNTTKGLRIILLPGWLFYLDGDDASVLEFPSKVAALLSVIVFCVELIVQLIARSVRRAQANARANRIEPRIIDPSRKITGSSPVMSI